MKNYMRLLAYIKPYTRRLALAVVCIIMAAGANLYLPWIIKDMIDDVLMSKDMVMLNLIAAGILVVMLLRRKLFGFLCRPAGNHRCSQRVVPQVPADASVLL